MEDLLDTGGKKSLGYFLSMVHSKPTDSWWNRFENALVSVAGYMVLYVTGLVAVDVIMRYFLNDPLNSSTVTAEIVMTMIVVLAGPWLYRENGWVKIDLITCKLKPKAQAFLSSVTGFITSGVMLIVGAGAWQKTYELIVTKATIINSGGKLPHAVWAVPMNVFYFVMVVVCFLKALENWGRYKALKAGLPDPHPEDGEATSF